MPNVEIVVEASLGDSLVKLDLAEHAVKDLGDSGEETSHKLRDFNASLDDATIASHRTGSAMMDTERLIRDAENAITGMTDAIDGGAAGGGGAGGGGLISALSGSVPLLGGFSVPLAAIPVVAVAAAAAVVALADAIGTLVAIVADLVAPLTLVTGLLGLLGAGFFLAAKKALGMHEDGLGQAISGLKKQFNDLTTTLVGDFMPVFQFLIHNAHDALDYLNRIAKLPLAEAFKSLATTGVQAVSKFLGKVGSMLAKPIRLAVQIAFGSGKGGNEISSAVSALWKQFTDFLFGYTKSHPVELRPGVFKIKTTTVDGALQPFLDWFNRHDFTKQGIKIGHELLNGLRPLAKPLGQFIVHVLEDAVKTAAVGMLRAINPFSEGTKQKVRELNNWMQNALVAAAQATWQKVESLASAAWSKVESLAKGHLEAIKTAILVLAAVFAGPVLSAVVQVAGAIGGITGLINDAISAANTLASALSAASLGSSNSTAGRTGQGGNSPGNPGGHIAVAHFHFHGSNDAASFRRFAREVGREIGRQNHILAGGQ